MHLDDERTQRWLHDELDDPAREAVEAHLRACDACQAQVAAAEAEEGWFRSRLAEIPNQHVQASLAGLRARAIAMRRWKWAATILLSCAAAGTAYAMPGSPVPRWVERVASWISRREAASPPTAPATAPAAPSGIVLPVEPSLTIRLRGGAAGSEARVVVVDSGGITVRVTDGQAGFTSSPGLLIVQAGDSGARVEVELPRGAPLVRIEAAGQRLFLLREGVVESAAVPERDGSYRLEYGGAAEP